MAITSISFQDKLEAYDMRKILNMSPGVDNFKTLEYMVVVVLVSWPTPILSPIADGHIFKLNTYTDHDPGVRSNVFYIFSQFFYNFFYNLFTIFFF